MSNRWEEQLAALDAVFGHRAQQPLSPTMQAMAARRQCEREGHEYRVHATRYPSTNPTKVSCKRCGVSWAIGARTEPTR